ncbi:MAG: hypothetical protein J6F30_05110, partial [Cellulosilyticum sp.]|nr:hypothetical protein [Cellulosilyticum sp.]
TQTTITTITQTTTITTITQTTITTITQTTTITTITQATQTTTITQITKTTITTAAINNIEIVKKGRVFMEQGNTLPFFMQIYGINYIEYH